MQATHSQRLKDALLAVDQHPDSVPELVEVALVYKEACRWNEAITAYQRALRKQPDHRPAAEGLAYVLVQVGAREELFGNYTDAQFLYRNALKHHLECWLAWYNMGVNCNNFAQLADEHEHKRQVAADSHEAQKHVRKDKSARARTPNDESTGRAASQPPVPDDPATRTRTNDFEESSITSNAVDAEMCFRLAIHFNPACKEAYNNLGLIAFNKGLLAKAEDYLTKAVAIDGTFLDAVNNLAVVKRAKGEKSEALELLKKAVAPVLNGDSGGPTVPAVDSGARSAVPSSIAHLYTALEAAEQSPTEAQITTYEQIMSRVDLCNNLAGCYKDECDIAAALTWFDKCIATGRAVREPWQNRLLVMNYLTDAVYNEEGALGLDTASYRTWAENWCKEFTSPRWYAPKYSEWPHKLVDKSPLPASTKKSGTRATPVAIAKRKLVIGYLSPDFCNHAVSYFVEAALRHHDKSKYTVICYSAVVTVDATTLRLKQFASVWRNVVSMTSLEIAQLIYQDNVDVLVDLAGHTGNNRLDVFARKPAPVQCTWIGYCNSTGLNTMDYRLVDHYTDPVGTTQWHSEQLLRLPHCFLCYTPSRTAPPVAPAPYRTNGFITFGSFNDVCKMNEYCVSVWCQILNRVPSSRMVLKSRILGTESVRTKYKQLFAKYLDGGLPAVEARFTYVGLIKDNASHLACYGHIDIMFDTFPYTGTTTTCDCMYQGVPVVTCGFYKNLHSANVSKSLLSQVEGMAALIGHSVADYVNIAVELANDPARVIALRQTLRDKMTTSPLMDGPGFTTALERLYEQIYSKWKDGQVAQPGVLNQASIPIRFADSTRRARPEPTTQRGLDATAAASTVTRLGEPRAFTHLDRTRRSTGLPYEQGD